MMEFQNKVRPPLPLAAALLALVPGYVAGQQGPTAIEQGWPSPVHEQRYGLLRFDRLEYAHGEDENTLTWELDGWYGGDYNRVWIKSEGEDSLDNGGEAEVELLYGRLIAPNWDFQAGIGYERLYGPGEDQDRASLIVGTQGLAPYWFEVDSALKVSQDGDVSATFEAEYDLLFTQRLVLTPRFETALAANEVPEFGIGQGINYVDLGLRLRYEIKREFAPYVGVSWRRLVGESADLAEAAGADVEHFALVAGMRLWF